jgi:hypothetical protein
MNLSVYALSDGDKGTLIAIANDEQEARVFMKANIPDLYEKIKDGKMTEQFIEESVIYHSYGAK